MRIDPKFDDENRKRREREKARLIAAAPELLETLEEVTEWLQDAAPHGLIRWQPVYEEVIKKSLSLINKVKGGDDADG